MSEPYPVTAGGADILVVLAPDGYLAAMRVKRPGQKPTTAQAMFLAAVRRNSVMFEVLYESVRRGELLLIDGPPPLPRCDERGHQPGRVVSADGNMALGMANGRKAQGGVCFWPAGIRPFANSWPTLLSQDNSEL